MPKSTTRTPSSTPFHYCIKLGQRLRTLLFHVYPPYHLQKSTQATILLPFPILHSGRLVNNAFPTSKMPAYALDTIQKICLVDYFPTSTARDVARHFSLEMVLVVGRRRGLFAALGERVEDTGADFGNGLLVCVRGECSLRVCWK